MEENLIEHFKKEKKNKAYFPVRQLAGSRDDKDIARFGLCLCDFFLINDDLSKKNENRKGG